MFEFFFNFCYFEIFLLCISFLTIVWGRHLPRAYNVSPWLTDTSLFLPTRSLFTISIMLNMSMDLSGTRLSSYPSVYRSRSEVLFQITLNKRIYYTTVQMLLCLQFAILKLMLFYKANTVLLTKGNRNF